MLVQLTEKIKKDTKKMLELATPWLFQEQVVKKNAFYIQEERRGGMMLS